MPLLDAGVTGTADANVTEGGAGPPAVAPTILAPGLDDKPGSAVDGAGTAGLGDVCCSCDILYGLR